MTARTLDIGLIADSRHPVAEPFAGGLEAHTHALAVGLKGRGHRVTVYASDSSDPGIGLVPVCSPRRRLRLSAGARADVSMPEDRFMEDHHAYLELMLDLRSATHDVLHNNSLHYLPIAMARSVPAPMVTALHTPPTPWIESAVQHASPDACSFVSVSASNARAWSHALRVCRTIPNGVDLGVWREREPDPHPYAVWTGRLVPEKGPHLAIDAARRAGVELRLAGPVSDRAYYDAAIAPRLGAGVAHVGHLPAEDLARLVGGARVALVTPCWDEPYGLVVAEALACGTPVAAFRRGAVPDIVDGTSGRLAAPGDVADLARALHAALALDRRDCRRRAETACSVDAMILAYERLYLELAR